jgi:putative ABC transport system substrate-binding protein
MVNVKRRQLIRLVGGAAAWPLAARAQQSGKVPTIGFLGSNASRWSPWTTAFVQRLRELGWIEGRTIAIEYRWSERHAEIAAELPTARPWATSLSFSVACTLGRSSAGRPHAVLS